MPWIIEIARLKLGENGQDTIEWRGVHPTGSPHPYEYPREDAAVRTMRKLYPNLVREIQVRVRDLTSLD